MSATKTIVLSLAWMLGCGAQAGSLSTPTEATSRGSTPLPSPPASVSTPRSDAALIEDGSDETGPPPAARDESSLVARMLEEAGCDPLDKICLERAHESPEARRARRARRAALFDIGVANDTLLSASRVAADCVSAAGPPGRCKVVTTFGNDGHATHVEVRPPCAQSDAAPCIEAAFMAARVRSFDGAPVSVSRSVHWGD